VPALSPAKLLVIRLARDEASLVLGLFQCAMVTLEFIWGSVYRFINRIAGDETISVLQGQRGWTPIFACTAAMSMFAAAIWSRNSIILVFAPLCLILWCVRAPKPFRALWRLLLVPLIPVAAVLALPFGPEFATFVPFVEVGVESTPPGSAEITITACDDDQRKAPGLLMHSASHEAPSIIALRSWLTNAERRGATTG
jgi:hypothetical protein